MRFLFTLNILVTGGLAAFCLTAPRAAGTALFGSAVGAATSLQMLGAWWAAVCLVSILGLKSPYKYRHAPRQSRAPARQRRTPFMSRCCRPRLAACPPVAAPCSSCRRSTSVCSWGAHSCRWRHRQGAAARDRWLELLAAPPALAPALALTKLWPPTPPPQGRWSAFPAAPAAVYSAYLVPLFVSWTWLGLSAGGAACRRRHGGGRHSLAQCACPGKRRACPMLSPLLPQACAPWGYLLGGAAAPAVDGDTASMRKTE